MLVLHTQKTNNTLYCVQQILNPCKKSVHQSGFFSTVSLSPLWGSGAWQHHAVHQRAAVSCVYHCGLLPSFHYHNKSVKRCLYLYLWLVYWNVCAELASLTRSMICLMVCRRMMPELFWSVPASLGSLSMEDKYTVTESYQDKKQTTINTGCAPIRHPCVERAVVDSHK